MKKLIEMDNKQLYNFTREQTQVFLTARLGDGNIHHTKSNSWCYRSNCKYREYLEFKKELIGKGKIVLCEKNGYSQTPIYEYYGGAYPNLKLIKEMNLKDILNNLDDLGLALWFYDDGSLHKNRLFYHLNTQKFSREEHEQIIIPYFESLGIKGTLRVDKSKSTNPLYYISIGKYDGAYEISTILSKYPMGCYSYKLWSSETIQKWSKLQEKLKSTDKELNLIQLGQIWRYL